jgi:hypothetical protein
LKTKTALAVGGERGGAGRRHARSPCTFWQHIKTPMVWRHRHTNYLVCQTLAQYPPLQYHPLTLAQYHPSTPVPSPSSPPDGTAWQVCSLEQPEGMPRREASCSQLHLEPHKGVTQYLQHGRAGGRNR